MAPYVQPPSPSSAYHETPMLTLQRLEYYSYDGGRVYSAFGTSHEQVLYPRRDARLVVSRPRKPLRAAAKRPNHPRKKIQWPDARNAKEVAAFCSEELHKVTNGPSSNAEDSATGTAEIATSAAFDSTTFPGPQMQAPTNGSVPPPRLTAASRIPRLSSIRLGRGANDA